MKGRKIDDKILNDPEVIQLRQILRQIDRVENAAGNRGPSRIEMDQLQAKSVQLQHRIRERGLNMTHVNAVVTSIWGDD